ncbi:ArsR/SmtB family transcription factor [Saliterribacillus persicus]|uniref:ArsR family transcriptional regulator n=1 Tax=Saliterribacillus persicus TaxID=930114 RepID=A0A368Y486_9BACI|nr:metalloregulator ArsR/SmtB family transcription factor [Saliterribacillus persicus]RCW74915.1 ArsR family transcriptional regulator [Saliterribacillus persicus]
MQDLKTWSNEISQVYGLLGKALANPKRVLILEILTQGESTVDSLSRTTNISVASVSQHLQVLAQAQLVDKRREKNYFYYSIADKDTTELFFTLQRIANKRVKEIKEIEKSFLANDSQIEAISASELDQRLKEEPTILLDVRPTNEYEEEHIPGAISIPLAQLEEKLTLLPKTASVVAYCRGNYCLMSQEAVDFLKKKGYQATTFAGNVFTWKTYWNTNEKEGNQDEN